MCPLTFLETSLSDWRANELICIFSPPIVLCQKLCNGKIENFTAWMCKCGQSDACLCVWMEKKPKHGASRQTEQNKKGIVDVSKDKTHNLTDPTDSSVCWEWNVCVNHSLTMPKSFLQSISCLFKIKKTQVKNILLTVKVSSCGYGSTKSVSGSRAESFRSWQRVKVSWCVLCTVRAQTSPCLVTRGERSECWAPGIMTGLRVLFAWEPLGVRRTEISEIRWLDKNGPEVRTR